MEVPHLDQDGNGLLSDLSSDNGCIIHCHDADERIAWGGQNIELGNYLLMKV